MIDDFHALNDLNGFNDFNNSPLTARSVLPVPGIVPGSLLALSLSKGSKGLLFTAYRLLSSVTLCDFKSVVEMKKGMAELTDTQIKALLRSHLERILEEDERDRALGRKSWTDKEGLADHVDAMAYLQHGCRMELAIGNYSRATGAVDRMLAEKGIELDRDGRGMMKVMINDLEIDMRRTRHDSSLDDLPFPLE
jgi:hypothetical protein